MKLKGLKIMNEAYFKFLKYFNIIDICVLICLYLRNTLFFVGDTNNYLGFSYELEFHISSILIFLFIMINNIYHIKKVGIKRKIFFIIFTTSIKLFSYQLITSLLFKLDEIKNFENAIMFLFWFYVGYLFLNSYGFFLESKKANPLI